jgi:BMFP domain-containing protein YqiC
MQTRNPFFDDVAKAMEGAMGLAQTMSDEAKAVLRAQGDRMAAELDLVRRDEFEAQIAALNAQISVLKAEIAQVKGAPPTA